MAEEEVVQGSLAHLATTLAALPYYHAVCTDSCLLLIQSQPLPSRLKQRVFIKALCFNTGHFYDVDMDWTTDDPLLLTCRCSLLDGGRVLFIEQPRCIALLRAVDSRFASIDVAASVRRQRKSVDALLLARHAGWAYYGSARYGYDIYRYHAPMTAEMRESWPCLAVAAQRDSRPPVAAGAEHLWSLDFARFRWLRAHLMRAVILRQRDKFHFVFPEEWRSGGISAPREHPLTSIHVLTLDTRTAKMAEDVRTLQPAGVPSFFWCRRIRRFATVGPVIISAGRLDDVWLLDVSTLRCRRVVTASSQLPEYSERRVVAVSAVAEECSDESGDEKLIRLLLVTQRMQDLSTSAKPVRIYELTIHRVPTLLRLARLALLSSLSAEVKSRLFHSNVEEDVPALAAFIFDLFEKQVLA